MYFRVYKTLYTRTTLLFLNQTNQNLVKTKIKRSVLDKTNYYTFFTNQPINLLKHPNRFLVMRTPYINVSIQ